MYWVYILLCEDGHIYVGQTSRLFRRWNEHLKGCGSINTSSWSPVEILAIYKVSGNESYAKYKYRAETHKDYKGYYLRDWGDDDSTTGDRLENYITQCLKNRYTQVCHWHIAGGKYCKFGLRIKPEIEEPEYDRPMCSCGLPAEVNYSEKNDYIYFCCPRSNKENLLDKFGGLDYDEPCKFWQKYVGDKEAREIWRKTQSTWTPPKRPIEQLKQLFSDD